MFCCPVVSRASEIFEIKCLSLWTNAIHHHYRIDIVLYTKIQTQSSAAVGVAQRCLSLAFCAAKQLPFLGEAPRRSTPSRYLRIRPTVSLPPPPYDTASCERYVLTACLCPRHLAFSSPWGTCAAIVECRLPVSRGDIVCTNDIPSLGSHQTRVSLFILLSFLQQEIPLFSKQKNLKIALELIDTCAPPRTSWKCSLPHVLDVQHVPSAFPVHLVPRHAMAAKRAGPFVLKLCRQSSSRFW